ncbi:MAG: RHS domain-containing protein, partial [Desulfobacterales bacterium]|nr:RHS domain-containing protein [Desulfobacterales bacterium]
MKKNILLVAALLVCSMFIVMTAVAADLLLFGPLDSGVYISDGNILTDETTGCTIASGNHVQFVTNSSIFLKPGFQASSGSYFTTYVNPADSIDVDDDGLDDSWELLYFGHLGFGPDDDNDNDGLTNYEEYFYGYDPTDSNSYPIPIVNYEDYKDIGYGVSDNEQQGGGGLISGNVRIFNGNALEFRTDLNFPSPNSMGLPFNAFYNSKSDISGILGYGWTHSYSASLTPSVTIGGVNYIKIIDATGKGYYFLQNDGSGAFNEHSSVENISGEYLWTRRDGTQLNFNSSGKLTWMDDEKDNRITISYNAGNNLQSVTDNASGRIMTFHYDTDNLLKKISMPTTIIDGTDDFWVTYGYTDGNLTSVSYADGSGIIYEYNDTNDTHNLTAKKTVLGHALNEWGYDHVDRATSVTRQGRTDVIDYFSGDTVYVNDAYGNILTYTIGVVSGMHRVTALAGIGAESRPNDVIEWAYDPANMNLNRVDLRNDTAIAYSNFDTNGNAQQIDIFGRDGMIKRTINFTWHSVINSVLTRSEASVLGSGDKETIYDYDDDYNTTYNESPTSKIHQIIEKGFSYNDAGSVVTYTSTSKMVYNSKGQVTSLDGFKNGTGDTYLFTYDISTGNLLTITQPIIGITTISDYDNTGLPSTITDVNNQDTLLAYDGRGRKISTTHDADSSVFSTVYNIAGLRESTTDEDGVSRTYSYGNNYGRLDLIIDPKNNYIDFEYNDQGDLEEKIYLDEYSSLTRWQGFSNAHPEIPGKLWKEINHDGTFKEYDYNATTANLESVTDPSNNTTTIEYDTLNNLWKVTQPGSVTTTYSYDVHGNLKSVIDGNGNTTTYIYDDMGRIVKTVSPDSGETRYSYDKAGNLVFKKDPNLISADPAVNPVIYIYDDLNRLTNVNFPDSSSMGYSYDSEMYAKGKLTGMSDSSGSTVYSYNARGQLVNKIATIDNISYSVSRTLSSAGRLESLTYPSGRIVNYERDTGCHCEVDRISSGGTVLLDNISYRPFGGADSMGTLNGGAVSNEYDLDGRLIYSNRYTDKERSYSYDANGNLTSSTSADMPWQNRTYGYNGRNQLDTATGSFGTYDFTYDKADNRLSKVIDGTTTIEIELGNSNKIVSISQPEGDCFRYDYNGNITGNIGKNFVYNQNNQIVEVREAMYNDTMVAEYVYNGKGQRVKKNVYDSLYEMVNNVKILVIANIGNTTVSETIVYHYDFDGRLIAESDENGSATAEYVFNGSNLLSKVDVSTGKIYQYANDHLGTPQMLIDENSDVVWLADYEPFGKAEVESWSSVENNIRFQGQYYDEETGLHYNYFRYYNPKTGRYMTPDPIGLLGGINLYAYV